MEIESIAVRADYCFGVQPLRLDGLKKVNFIFAPNGAGKSTISNMLARQPADANQRETWDVARTNLPIRVFNEAYRSRVLTERVNGIFTIGETSTTINDQILAVKKEIRDRTTNRDKWRQEIGPGPDENNPIGLLGEIESYRLAARKEIFSAHKNIDESLIPIVFEGYRGSQDKLFDEARKRFGEMETSNSDVDWETLKTRARSLSKGKKTRVKLPEIRTVNLISAGDIAEVASKSFHGQDGKFAELIQHLKNEDWVSKGRDYVDDAQGKCPFCQNQAPANLEQDLTQYFEGGFDSALQRSIKIEDAVKVLAVKLEDEISTLEVALSQDIEVIEDDFAPAISHVREAVKLLLSELRERSSHPTQPIEVSDVDVVLSELVKLIDAENERIEQHNQIVRNVGVERTKLINDGWIAFLSGTAVSIEMKKFNGFETR